MSVTIRDFEGKVIDTMSTEEAVRRGYELSESIPTQDSLKTHQQAKAPSNDDVVKAIGVLMHLSPDERQKHFERLGLRSHEGGDGVSDGTAEKSRKSLKGAQAKKDMPKLKKELFSGFNDEELSEEFKEHATEIFHRKISKASARDALIEMFSDNPELNLLLMSEERLDAVSMLADRIEWLEEQIAAVELERDMLVREAAERERSSLSEEVLYSDKPRPTPSSDRLAKVKSHRSLDHDFAFNEDGESLTGDNKQQVTDPAMRARLALLERVTRHVDRKQHKDYLVETWGAQK
jgi:hypothetical protein